MSTPEQQRIATLESMLDHAAEVAGKMRFELMAKDERIQQLTNHACPNVVFGSEGTQYCALAESSVAALTNRVLATEALANSLRACLQDADAGMCLEKGRREAAEALVAEMRSKFTSLREKANSGDVDTLGFRYVVEGVCDAALELTPSGMGAELVRLREFGTKAIAAFAPLASWYDGEGYGRAFHDMLEDAVSDAARDRNENINLRARVAEQDAELQRLRDLVAKNDRDAITNGGYTADLVETVGQLTSQRDALIAVLSRVESLLNMQRNKRPSASLQAEIDAARKEGATS